MQLQLFKLTIGTSYDVNISKLVVASLQGRLWVDLIFRGFSKLSQE